MSFATLCPYDFVDFPATRTYLHAHTHQSSLKIMWRTGAFLPRERKVLKKAPDECLSDGSLGAIQNPSKDDVCTLQVMRRPRVCARSKDDVCTLQVMRRPRVCAPCTEAAFLVAAGVCTYKQTRTCACGCTYCIETKISAKCPG